MNRSEKFGINRRVSQNAPTEKMLQMSMSNESPTGAIVLALKLRVLRCLGA
eukprot:m.42695 g.42695  ORF g.42695 m.42695 type:complete len:51 (-) comp8351_c0_seq1:2380-2532(-)